MPPSIAPSLPVTQRSPIRRLALALALATVAAPPPGAAAPAAAAAPGLSVAASANLKLAVQELRRAFETARPGARVAVTLGASGLLLAQIQSGAPFDVFLSADREYPARLVEAGLARREDERVYALGRLVLWLPPGTRARLDGRGLAALADPGFRHVAIANPGSAPYGRAAEAALRSAGVYPEVRAKLVLGQSVSQAAQFAASGAADAALLPLPLARDPGLAGGTAVPIPESLHPPLAQSAVVLAGARDAELARAFLDFVAGPPGRAILERHGYGLP